MIRKMKHTEWHQDHWLSHMSRESSIPGATIVLFWVVIAVHRKSARQQHTSKQLPAGECCQ